MTVATPRRELSPATPAGAAGELAGTIHFRERSWSGGFTTVPNVVLRSTRLNPTAKVLYGLLLSYAWERDRTWPGQDVLASHLGATTRTVRNALADLRGVGLITVEQRGLRQTNVYWIEPLEAFTHAEQAEDTAGTAPALAPEQDGELRRRRAAPTVVPPGVPAPPRFRSERKNSSGQERQPISGQDRKPASDEEDSPEEDPREQHHAEPAAPATLAPTTPDGDAPTGAVDDALLALLISHGITRRTAMSLVRTYPAERIRQQVAWHAYRPAAKNPAGALVEAIRDAWPLPPAWLDAREHAAEVARQAEEEARRRAEDEARRREWEAKPPEERIQGRLLFWIQKQRLKAGREPTEAELAAKRAELLAELVAGARSVAAGPGGVS